MDVLVTLCQLWYSSGSSFWDGSFGGWKSNIMKCLETADHSEEWGESATCLNSVLEYAHLKCCVCVLICQEFQVKFCSNYPGHCGIDAGHSRSRSAHCEEIRLWGKVRNTEINQRCCSQTRQSAQGHMVESALNKRRDVPEASGPHLLRSCIFHMPTMVVFLVCVTHSLSV